MFPYYCVLATAFLLFIIGLLIRRWRRSRDPLGLVFRDGHLVRERTPVRMNIYAMGFKRQVENKQLLLLTSSQVPFKPISLHLIGPLLEECEIIDIKVGKNSMTPTADPIPAVMFKLHNRIKIEFNTIQISQVTSIRIGWREPGNHEGAPTIDAVMTGKAIE